ncbi:MAG: hypothetical protein Q9176_003834 [Flavoplaca citrina]
MSLLIPVQFPAHWSGTKSLLFTTAFFLAFLPFVFWYEPKITTNLSYILSIGYKERPWYSALCIFLLVTEIYLLVCLFVAAGEEWRRERVEERMALPRWEEKVTAEEVEVKGAGDFVGSPIVAEFREEDGA